MISYGKLIDIEDFSSEELKPYFKRIAHIEAAQFGITTPAVIPDSKNWEIAMALYGFDNTIGDLRNKNIAGIGAGTELLTELLAERGAIIFPSDRYLEKTAWSDVVPQGYMISSQSYNQIPNVHRNIIPVHADARALEMPSNFFDAVYSSGSIEHFGGLAAVEAAAAEISRILKPGGIASISTEFRLSGPVDKLWFDESCILFTFDMLKEHIIKPSGLTLLELNEAEQSPATFDTRKDLAGFLTLAKQVNTIEDKKNAYPNLILEHEGFLFCSVHILAQKPVEAIHEAPDTPLRAEVERDLARVVHAFDFPESLDSMEQAKIIPQSLIDHMSLSTILLKKARRFVECRPKLRRLLLGVLRCSPWLYARLKRRTET